MMDDDVFDTCDCCGEDADDCALRFVCRFRSLPLRRLQLGTWMRAVDATKDLLIQHCNNRHEGHVPHHWSPDAGSTKLYCNGVRQIKPNGPGKKAEWTPVEVNHGELRMSTGEAVIT